ncbi:MAG: DUF1648 domain-containing protein [Erysipelotrichaceae bacterium]|nr:DUF1648 domain-containing protein [Erysipelotrichaceae bacterium]
MERAKKNKKHIIITTVLTLLPILIGLILWNRLPEQMPTHFGVNGEPDQYSSKAFAVFFFPVLLLFIQYLMIWGTLQDPKNSRVSDKIFTMIIYVVPIVSLLVNVLIYLKAMNFEIDITRIMMCFVSLVFIIMGNYLPKTRQNYTIGIKIPWTLDDPENWDKTHRLAGYLFMVIGILIFISTFIPGSFNLYFMVALFFASIIIPFVYSYMLYRNKKTTEN